MGLVETSTFDALKATWEAERLAPLTKRFPERRERFTTSSDDIEVRTLYTPADLAGDAPGELAESAEERYLRTLGYGDYPLARGVQPNIPQAAVDHAASTPVSAQPASNTRYKYLIAQEQNEHSPSPSTCPQIGYDADDFAEGEVGKVGVSINEAAGHGDAARRHRPGQGEHQHDHPAPAAGNAGDDRSRSQEARRTGQNYAARCRTTCSRSTSPAAPTSTRPANRCA